MMSAGTLRQITAKTLAASRCYLAVSDRVASSGSRLLRRGVYLGPRRVGPGTPRNDSYRCRHCERSEAISGEHPSTRSKLALVPAAKPPSARVKGRIATD